MCKFNPKNDSRRIDTCMKKEIKELNEAGIVTLSCCCGHGKYPKTVVVKHQGTKMPWEYFSKQYILRKKKFYKKDKQGYYYIPEVCSERSGETKK